MSKDFKEKEVVLSKTGGMKCDKSKARWDKAPWLLFEKIVDSITEKKEIRWE